jgi:lysozyme family protein
LQRAAGTAYKGKVDGVWGNLTAAAALKVPAAELAKSVCRQRISMYRTLKTWATFGTGWTRRVTDCEATSVAMALRASSVVVPAPSPVPGIDKPTQDPTVTPVTDVFTELTKEADKAKQQAANENKQAAGGGAAAAGSGGVSTTVTDDITFWLFIIGFILAFGFLAYKIWKGRVEKTREKSYEEAANNVGKIGQEV